MAEGDVIVCFAVVLMTLHGFLITWAFRHEDKPFWRGYLDVATLRILWRKQ